MEIDKVLYWEIALLFVGMKFQLSYQKSIFHSPFLKQSVPSI